jgi:hypothetical protein
MTLSQNDMGRAFELVVAFCTAVDLGVRIGKKETAKT